MSLTGTSHLAAAPTHFPFFFNMKGKKVVVVGAGAIGSRRIRVLLPFECTLHVIAPTLHPSLYPLRDRFTWLQRTCQLSDLQDADFVLAATDNAQLHATIAEYCRSNKIPVNLCDAPHLCDFYFPALVENDHVLLGLISTNGKQHHTAKATAAKLRQFLHTTSEEY